MAEQSLEQLEQEFHQIVSGIHPADVVTKEMRRKSGTPLRNRYTVWEN